MKFIKSFVLILKKLEKMGIYKTEIFLSKDKVLTIDEFYRIAQSFFETQVKPDFIEWEKI